MDALVIGAGFAGAVAAERLSSAGMDVLVVEKRPHIGGNMYDSADGSGVLVHWYGPHIFHTNDKEVYEYLQRFSRFHPYRHRVKGKIRGKTVPVPFGFSSIDALLDKEEAEIYKASLKEQFAGKERVSVRELLGHGDIRVRELGAFVFENVFLNYTAKQWGIPAAEVDASVIDRVPVVIGYDDRYFQDCIQMMPDEGYTPIFRVMLGRDNIAVKIGTNALEMLSLDGGKVRVYGEEFKGPVVYTGPLDELFNFRFGHLPYRSLELDFESLPTASFQSAAVVNYPNEEDFTRITEFKKLTGQRLDGHTTILREYPRDYEPGKNADPYYPIKNPANRALHGKYLAETEQISNLYVCGRLAEYRYYNMDAVIARALRLSEGILGGQPAAVR